MEPRELAEQDYLNGMKYKDIAEKYGVTINTVKSWKTRYKWSRDKGAPTEKSVHTKRPGAKQVRTISMPDPDADVDERYALFAAEYLRDFNATRAAMAVGYKKSIAHTAGWRLLKKDEVQAEIKRLKELMSDELVLDIRRIIAEYMKIAFADVTDVLDFGQREVPVMTMFGPMYEGEGDEKKPVTKLVNYIDLRASAEIDTTVIAEVKQGKDGVSIKLHDKMRALEKLERYVGYMTAEEKARLAKLQAEVKVLEGPGDVKTDDGFMDAIKGKAAEIWADEPAETPETEEGADDGEPDD